MSLPNSHEALLRNRHLLQGRTALLGLSADGILAHLPAGGMVMSEHAGICASLAGHDGWQVCFGYDDPALAAGTFDTLLVFLPKARAELDLRLALARWLAVPGARIVLVGEKKEGIAGAVKQLKAVAPSATKIDSARHCQVWCADQIESLPEFSLQQWMTWTRIDCRSVSVEVSGLPGIFSLGELDEGTRLLLDTLDDNPLRSGSILDFACGAGTIGSWLHGWHEHKGQPPVQIDGIDVQSQAVVCARATYERNGVSGRILASDGLKGVEGRWPVILSNPPFHTGIRTDLSMTELFLRDLVRHLEPGGEVRLVANSFLPYEPLMKRCIGPVERLREDRRFTVYRAFRRS
ncbi:class I SAM-dependent methyltransferase [Marinobacter sp. F3R08]|uniref:class I SAM-dependent methyltransferase n=1 Tax=Marinobacter sp. F3R08 TaxID=2841559 RepID=UPI001C08278E|nr:class I SAM-dependent methyltransferase [Marinobacter sp. F3R08]MBU2955297.1 class I SAM-dependent methyltransferase [Marinobacter sp. F3R08]